MTARYIVQVGLQAQDGLPANVFENVWHWTSPAPDAIADDVDRINNLLSVFYRGLGEYFSEVLTTVVTVKGYDEDAPHPRPLLYHGTFSWTPGGAVGGMPEEVALCMSYYAGTNDKGHRGRVYLGPLSTAAIVESTTEGSTGNRPSNDFLTAIAGQGAALIAATTQTWCVKVTKPGVEYKPITNGWIDDEWDAQRRRRIAATRRVTFT
jgi:hypothetical protein